MGGGRDVLVGYSLHLRASRQLAVVEGAAVNGSVTGVHGAALGGVVAGNNIVGWRLHGGTIPLDVGWELWVLRTRRRRHGRGRRERRGRRETRVRRGTWALLNPLSQCGETLGVVDHVTAQGGSACDWGGLAACRTGHKTVLTRRDGGGSIRDWEGSDGAEGAGKDSECGEVHCEW